MKYIPYGRQTIDQNDIDAVTEVLKSDWVTQGPSIQRFETALCDYSGAKYAVAVSSGTAALHCSMYALGIGAGDEIITSPITFAASGNCVLYLGGTVRFVDIKPDTYCIDYRKLEEAITPRTKAIIAVDFTGQPCDMDEINAIAQKHKLAVVDDAAHSLGATYKDNPVGALAAMTIFSFHPVKHITTGEGGMIVTNNKMFAEKMRTFRTHGIINNDDRLILKEQAADNENLELSDKNPDTRSPWYYEMQDLGYNYRISDIQCALGLNQLKKLDSFITRRLEIVQRYNEAFEKSPYLVTPHQESDRSSAWHLYVLRLRLDKMKKSRREVFEELRALNIGVHVHYIPLHLQPYYRTTFGYKRGDFPEAESFYDSALTIPLFPTMTNDDCERVINSVTKVIR